MFDDYVRASEPDDTAFYADHAHAAQKRRGLRADQVPFRLALRLPDEPIRDILRDLECRELAQLASRQLETIGAVLANLAMAPSGFAIFYSRDHNFYAALKRYLPKHCSYRRVTATIEILTEHGLLHHRRTRPSPNAWFRSCFWASAALAQRLTRLPAAKCIIKPQEPIVLRGADKLPEPYPETAATERMRHELIELNEFLGQFHISVEHPQVIQDERGFLHVGDQRFNPCASSSYRIFTQRFDQNGRFYGAFWQNLPSEIRKEGLRIDGSPVVERDYRTCHLRILCALAGWQLPFHDPAFDPFAGWKFERRLVKTAFVMLLNNRCRHGARAALAAELVPSDESGSGGPRAAEYQRARELLEAVESAFPFLHRYWCRGFGLRLLNIDAEICALNMHALMAKGIPCLSVHDSFIVPVQHCQTLDGIMEESFREVTDHLS